MHDRTTVMFLYFSYFIPTMNKTKKIKFPFPALVLEVMVCFGGNCSIYASFIFLPVQKSNTHPDNGQ